MDSFENLMGTLLEREGYWVKTSFKINLTKAEKVKIGRPTTPRWELDLVAYKPGQNELLIVECKSFLNSAGVSFWSVVGKNEKGAKCYKLFNEPKTLTGIKRRLIQQLTATGACFKKPDVKLCLAAGKIRNGENRQLLQAHFDKKGWLLFDQEWLKEKLEEYSKSDYENDVAAIVTKLMTAK